MTYAEGKRLNAERAVNQQRIRLTHLRNAQARGENVAADIEITETRLAGAKWLLMSDAERAEAKR